jgi:hypothetical protein
MGAPFVATSRLSNIIQMIVLSRQTGILRAIRGHGPTREFGQIQFVDGEPQNALLGQIIGQAALNALNNWGECHYSFDEIAVDSGDWAWQGSGPYGSNSGAGYPSTNSSGNPSSASWPAYGYQNGRSNGAPSSPWGGPESGMSPYGPPGYSPRYSQPAPSSRTPFDNSGPLPPPLTSYSLPPLTPEILQIIPRRTPMGDQFDQLPLDRRERMALMLVDGKRTIADLARLTRRQEQEFYSVLAHLEALGLVMIRGW